MSDSGAEKKHAATPQRRKKAREEGHFAVSRDLNAAIIMLAASAALWWSGPGIMRALRSTLAETWGTDIALAGSPNQLVEHLSVTLSKCLLALLPFLASIFGVAILSYWTQSGFHLFPGRLRLDVARINPFSGLRRMSSLPNWIQLGFGLAKLLAIVLIIAWNLRVSWSTIHGSLALDLIPLAGFMWNFTLSNVLQLSLAFLALGILEYGVQHWRHEHSLRMTDQELRDEMKSTVGDPQLAANRRAVHQRLLAERIDSSAD